MEGRGRVNAVYGVCGIGMQWPSSPTHPSGEQARFMTFVGSVLGRTVPEKQTDDASILTRYGQ